MDSDGSSSDDDLIFMDGRVFVSPEKNDSLPPGDAEPATITLNPTPQREFVTPAPARSPQPSQPAGPSQANTNWDDWAFGFGSSDVSPSLAQHKPAMQR
eukprot:scaffold677209_cov38-Prasinocladus_malaysianus.AAC.1